MDYIVQQFKDKLSTGPQYVCSVCHRQLFKHQVIQCKKDTYGKKGNAIASLASKCITETYLHKCESTCTDPNSTLWICYTCHRKLLDGRMPPESVANNLVLDPIPPHLKNLNSLEQHLIAVNIPFMKMLALPKGGQNGVHGPVTCVPSNLPQIASVLPRPEHDDLMIRVKLKRKLTYKGHYEYQYVNTAAIHKAFSYLKQHNPWYKDITFNHEWINPLNKILQPNNPLSFDNETCVEINTENTNDEASTETTPDDEHIDESIHDTQQHGMFNDTCLQPVDIVQEVMDQHFDGILSLAPAQDNNPVRLLTNEGNEAKCFPVLFPKGTGTFNDTRGEKLTICRYFNNRILNADGRFAKNLDYIFYAQYLSEINQVVSNVSIALRKGYDSGRKITSDMLINEDSLQRILHFDEGYKFMKPIRGTPAFWQSVQKDLFAMVRQLGIPTWFCSFSSADMRWKETLQIFLRLEGKHINADDLDWSERCDLLRKNPVTAARMFDHRFHCFLKDVIMSPAQPIGKIVDYFYRVEFQQRGSPHTHCLFWVENAPQVDKADDADVVAFIDQYVTCEMPPLDDKEMHDIVSTVQQHSKRHSKSCRKNKTVCRFNFPRPPSKNTFITRNKISEEEMPSEPNQTQPQQQTNHPRLSMELAGQIMERVRQVVMNTDISFDSADSLFASIGICQELFEAAYIRMTKKTNVVLQRKPSDVWVNQYNTQLLRCWNANMDIQYVVDAYSCIVYIISYISKQEREMGLLLQQAQKEASNNIDAKLALRKLGSVYLHNREVSAQESIYRLTNMRLKEGSRKVQFIPTGQHPIKMSLPLHLLQKRLNTENNSIWMNSITDKYKGRPKTEAFPEMCLATFASQYRILSKADKSSPNSIKLDQDLGFVMKRTRTDAAVVRYARFSRTKNPEKYYHSILQLFLPHYNDSELKPPNFNTFEDFYHTGFVQIINSELKAVKFLVDTNQKLFEKEADEIDNAQEHLNRDGPPEDAWSLICPESELQRLQCLEAITSHVTNTEETDEILPDLQPDKSNTFTIEPRFCGLQKDTAMCLLRSLNEKQLQLFYKIRHWCLQKLNNENPDPFYVFITGGAGTGKSHLIKAINYEASRILSQLSENPDDTHVLLTAPTGVAAYNIDAATIHNCFSIGIDVSLPYQPLAEEKINTLRAKLNKIQIVIIDEISMVDHKLLTYIHGRLRQIKQTGDYSSFGKVSIIAVGDLYQLPPVKGKPLYTQPSGVNLWQNHFAVTELTEIVRQKDTHFAQLLNRLRTHKKKQPLQQQDINMLKSRETGEGEFSEDLHIYATNQQVDTHNFQMLHKMCPHTTSIEAQDFDRDAKTGRLKRKMTHHLKVYNTCLVNTLHLGIHARVMLLKNIDVSDGLANGVFGTVSDISYNDDDTFPSRIYVTFDDEKVGQMARNKKPSSKPGLEKATPIEPEEDKITNSGGVRRQFALKLAWACTVHKVQGLTVEKAVVSLNKMFSSGQAYVALSRVTSLEGLIIDDFKATAIYANDTIHTSIQNMPAFIEPPLQSFNTTYRIFLHNVQGLSAHIEDIRCDHRYFAADVICVTETWLQQQHSTQDTHLDTFSFHSKPRCLAYDDTEHIFMELKKQQHGGVGLYFKNDADCNITHLPCLNIECLTFSIKSLEANVAILYRPPSYSLVTFRTKLLHLIHHLDTFLGTKIIMGDFNENLFITQTVQDFMQQHGYTQLVKQATTEKATLIDHIYVKDNTAYQIDIQIMQTYFSFHNCIVMDVFQ
ncbi:uncharacterized protein LOC118219420 [Anguilla anguilla]|uniref:uncharacterized protein LOC118219420 n=1 Tax=Anguilla anguilla TaxID=7936 RepID=UPI0015AA7E0C|nr:uncharacterized protein LOC118219420 [Anguilla anguilla]